MTRSRKFLYQAAFVAGFAGFSAARARPAEAAPVAAVGCTALHCSEDGQDCGSVWLDIDCGTCGGDAFPLCERNLWYCPSNQVYYGCAFAT